MAGFGGGGGGCYLNGACCNGNVTKNVGDAFTHKGGGASSPIPLNAFCTVPCYVRPQIKVSGVWTQMSFTSSPTTPITTDKLYRSAFMNRPCYLNASFVLTVQPSAGGTTQYCRYKVTQGVYTYYCYFNVTVPAPVTALQRVMICTT